MTNITLDSRVCIRQDVLLQELHGEAVLLHMDTGLYFSMDKVGTRIWNLLKQHELLAEVQTALCEQYEVDEDRCRQDLLAFVARMLEQQLVVVGEAPVGR